MALDVHHLNMLLIIGLSMFFGTIGAKLFQKLHVPQIIGYITIGIVLGPLLGIITPEALDKFNPFNIFALGVIGFLIGRDLTGEIFAKYGKQVFYILLAEGLSAFVLSGTLCTLVMRCFFDWNISIAAGLVFGAICSATDPPATVAVLWEYKTRGPLTTMLTAIVALDDALAMVLYITTIAIAGVLTGTHNEGSFLMMAGHAIYEMGGSVALGIGLGFLLKWIISQLQDNDKILVYTISMIILDIGLAKTFGLDVILSSMAFGTTLINIAPRRSIISFDIIKKISPPIYVLFFVIIGARLNLGGFGPKVWALATAYLIGGGIGKVCGAYWGGAKSKAAVTVKKYLGFGLFQQGTIAIALLMTASTRFEGEVKDIMLSVIILGVFVFQIIGPFFVKMGVKRAGEIGLNVTEDDLMKQYTVKEVMDSSPAIIHQELPLDDILNVFSTTDSLYYPVVDNQSKLTGIITVPGIKETFAHQSTAGWLLACDIAEPIEDKTSWHTPLTEAIERMKKYNLEHMPVVSSEDDKLVGVLSWRDVNRKISAEVLKKHEQADEMACL